MASNISRRTFLACSALQGTALAMPAVTKASHPQSAHTRKPLVLISNGSEIGARGTTAAWTTLHSGGSTVDATVHAANIFELDPQDTSVGYGGLPNADGVVELDACIMWGKEYNAGAVASLRNIKTPSSVARLVMERTDHVLLVGEGALRFAVMHGFKEENLLTETARKRWLEWKETMSDKDDWLPNPDAKLGRNRPTGTVNVLILDTKGDMAGITTTSGLAFKIPGRVGDSPIIGAGLYVDNDVGAAGATGRGEEVMKSCGSFLVVEKMREGFSPQAACEYACQRIIDKYKGHVFFNDKYVAINKDGAFGCAQIRPGTNKAPAVYTVYNADGNRIEQGSVLLEN